MTFQLPGSMKDSLSSKVRQQKAGDMWVQGSDYASLRMWVRPGCQDTFLKIPITIYKILPGSLPTQTTLEFYSSVISNGLTVQFSLG